MRGITVLTAAIILAGCTPTIQSSNPVGGTINLKSSNAKKQGFALAEAECAKYGKHARITNNDEWTGLMRYDCVAG